MKQKIFLILALILALSTSCVVTQHIDLANSTAESSVHAKDFMVSVLEDLSCWTGSDEDDAIMDVAITSVAKGIAKSDFSKYVYINKADDNSYHIAFGYKDLMSMINQICGDVNQDIVSIDRDGEHSTLSFRLSMENYDTLKKLVPLLSDPNFEAYGPVYNNPPYDYRTEEDYLYMMEFIFGEEAGIIADSTVSIVIDTPTPIINTTGVIVSETETVFEFRLMDFLLLHNPICFSCTY